MFRGQWNQNVPRVEHDHRARQARRRHERVERLFLADPPGRGVRLVRLVRLVGLSVAGGGSSTRKDGGTGSMNDQQTYDIVPAVPIPTCARGGGQRPAAPCRPSQITRRAA
jgi:hypothetical protein